MQISSSFQGLFAQPASDIHDETYGLDPLLYNGKYYTYYVQSGTKGTPFFNGPDFVEGAVRVRGITYDHLSLKYDVVNQQLVLQYQIITGGVKQIVLSDAWLESFDLDESHFEMLVIKDLPKQIYQVIGNGPTRVLYSLRKDLSLDVQIGSHNYVFSELRKNSFLYSSDQVSNFNNNKKFIAFFDSSKQATIRKYLRHQGINVKKASDHTMSELINFCNSL